MQIEKKKKTPKMENKMPQSNSYSNYTCKIKDSKLILTV